MKVAYLVLSWFFGIIFGLSALSMLLTKNWLQAIALLLIVLLLPPLAGLVQGILGRAIPMWIRVVSIVILLAIFVALMNINQPSSIYKSPEIEARFMEMYDARLEDWPVAYQSVFVDTSYGKIHVIISGPEDAPPVLLLHASGVAGWSWIYNVEELSKHYRTYAIDTLGDAGKSVLYDLDTYPPDGQAQSALITELTEKLGVGQADVVGASEGGFIGTNYALYAPERVQKLILLGPMGYAGTNASILRIMLAQFYPLKPVQESTFRWAFGDDPRLNEGFGEWFRLLMAGVFPRKARPTQFTPEQLQGLDVPVLLVLGKKDKLVGNPENAKMQAQDIPDLRVEMLDSGHLIGAEQPEQVNSIIIEFLGMRDTQP